MISAVHSRLTVLASTVLTAVLALLAPVLAPVLTSPATAATGSHVRVGSFNINASVSTATFRRAVSRFRADVDVAGLQEVNNDPKVRFLKHMRGWGAYHPGKLRQNPVIWRTSEFARLDARGAKIASARYVGHEKPGAPAHRHPQWATVVRLRHRATGVPVSVVNVHLVAGAVNSGRCLRDAPRLCRLYKDSVAGLRRVTAQERAWAHGRVYVIGDMNDNYPADRRRHQRDLAYAQLRGAGLVAHWERRREIRPSEGSGTRGGAYLDQMWARRKPVSIAVDHSIKVSDHYPILAVYDARTTR